jgi:MoaA/NifB/PqqE/SkfB family radical SAM enzyme
MSLLDVILPTIGPTVIPMVRRSRQLPDAALENYEKCFRQKESPYLCNAPFNNMYFSVNGLVGACWLTNTPFIADRWSPTRSIKDIWFGESFERLRREIRAGNLHTYCNVCEHNIREMRRPLATVYDIETPTNEYPKMMELELSNLCNLECVMCTGLLSSEIREKRERKSPLFIPYTEKFAVEMEEFIPHLKQIRFSGGEPTRHKLVYKLLERIERLNPKDLPVTITTNGTTFAPPIARWFERVNLNMGVSLDSLTKDIYERIRINANFDKVLANVEAISAISRRLNRLMTIQMNPMTMNWHEMPHFVRFCNDRGIWLHFNTVRHPKEVSLCSLPKKELARIYETLSKESFDIDKESVNHNSNVRAFREAVETQIRAWAGGSKEALKI